MCEIPPPSPFLENIKHILQAQQLTRAQAFCTTPWQKGWKTLGKFIPQTRHPGWFRINTTFHTSLKGQCHDIVCRPPIFRQSHPSGPLGNRIRNLDLGYEFAEILHYCRAQIYIKFILKIIMCSRHENSNKSASRMCNVY